MLSSTFFPAYYKLVNVLIVQVSTGTYFCSDETAAAPVVASSCDEKAEHIAKQFAPLNLHLLPPITQMLIHFFSVIHVDLLGIPYVWWSRIV